MKKGTRNLLIVGAAGLGAYFLFVKPALSKTPAQAGAEAGAALGGGAVGFGEGFLGAIVAPFQAVIDSLLRMIPNNLSIPQPSPVVAPAPLATSFNNTTYSPANVSAVLTRYTPQMAVSQQFGTPANSNVNYLASVGAGTPAATWGTSRGTYNPSTGVFMNTSGQGSSVASYYVRPAATYAPATTTPRYTPTCPPVVRASPLTPSIPYLGRR